MTQYEAIDLIISAGSNFDAIFGYWISVSFAVIGATYIVRNELNIGLVLAISGVYLVASAMFLVRFSTLATLLVDARNHPEIPEEFLQSLDAQTTVRGVTFIGGILITEFFVLYSYFKHRGTSRR